MKAMPERHTRLRFSYDESSTPHPKFTFTIYAALLFNPSSPFPPINSFFNRLNSIHSLGRHTMEIALADTPPLHLSIRALELWDLATAMFRLDSLTGTGKRKGNWNMVQGKSGIWIWI